jgi:hypothetical protein
VCDVGDATMVAVFDSSPMWPQDCLDLFVVMKLKLRRAPVATMTGTGGPFGGLPRCQPYI